MDVRIPRRDPIVLLASVLIVMVALGIAPRADRLTWFLENVPVMIAAPILVATYRRFPLTDLVYRLIALHALILMIGGFWTYAKVPAGLWVQDLLGLARNPYDRLGHFAQGFVPAVIAREVLLRSTPLRRGKMLWFLVVCVCLAISACYEFTEWWAAVAAGGAADAFLGTQGDVWDTQWDMFMAFVGANAALILLTRIHDRHLVRLGVG
ncbi:MAG: DUF2238 domain-containing protein [Acidobacteriota bacterium]